MMTLFDTASIDFINESATAIVKNLVDEDFKNEIVVIEDYLKNNDVLVNVKIHNNRLYDVYGSNTLRNAIELANLLAQVSRYTEMRTIIPYSDFTISVRMRDIVAFHKLDADMKPRPFEQILLNAQVRDKYKLLPPEIELFKVYWELYSINKHEFWDQLKVQEVECFVNINPDANIIGGSARSDHNILHDSSVSDNDSISEYITDDDDAPPIKRNAPTTTASIYDTIGGRGPKRNKLRGKKNKQWYNVNNDKTVLNMHQEILKLDCVIVGDYALKSRDISVSSNRLQIISQNQEETLLHVKEIIKRHKLLIDISLFDSFPLDFRIKKYTVYCKTDGEHYNAIVDIYNSAEFELIPYNLINSKKIAHNFVLSRFLLIDWWVNLCKYRMSLNSGEYLKKQSEIITHITKCRNNVPVIKDVFGIYMSADIARKDILRAAKFPPYIPAKWKDENGSYKTI